MTFVRSICLALGFSLLLAACGQSSGGNQPNTATPTAGTARLSVVTAKQTPSVDQMARGLSAGQYFDRLRTEVRKGTPGFSGASGTMELAIRNGNTVHWRGSCTLDAQGGCDVDVAMANVKPNSSFCMKTPWPIAHQRLRPDFNDNQNWVCADGLHDYYVLGRRNGKFVAAAIQAAS